LAVVGIRGRKLSHAHVLKTAEIALALVIEHVVRGCRRVWRTHE
jgi:hypothetical protein